MTEHKSLLPAGIINQLPKITRISKKLRKEMELAFYGDEDFIPTEEYDAKDAKDAIRDANFVVNKITTVVRLDK